MVPTPDLGVGRGAPRCQTSSYSIVGGTEEGVVFHQANMVEGPSMPYANYCRCSHPQTVHELLHHVVDGRLLDDRRVKQPGPYQVTAIIRGLQEVSQAVLGIFCACMDVPLVTFCSTSIYH
ncbi:uncharacterized protein DS421_2g40960 [Arachis hypogaea]|nr:uncharacterized protein DS421_2g40960 [Arachis hypogaea]